MGKGGQLGVDPSISAGELANSTAMVGIAQDQAKNSQQLYQASFPGFQQAEGFYQSLASGDPGKIAQAIAPATQQISQATTSAKNNIMNNAPNGGEKNLALEQADVAQGAKVGEVASSGYLNSFNALASLAGQGIGQGISSAGTGLSGFSSSTAALGQIGQQQIEKQKMEQEQKGASMGMLGGLAGDVAGVAGSFAGTEAGAAALAGFI